MGTTTAAAIAIVLATTPGAKAAGPAASAPPRSAEADAVAYEQCMQLARDDPEAAAKFAANWHERGSKHPSEHCAAVALIGLKQYPEAAARLEALARDMLQSPVALRAGVLEQAGQAWMLAANYGRAYEAISMALSLRPGDPDLLVDRAAAAGEAHWFDKAVEDLDRVLKDHPDRVDALVYRAAAYRAQGRTEAALADLDKALAAAPDTPAALLERGNLLALKGDFDGARRDWSRAAAAAPTSAAAVAAKSNIERLTQRQKPAAAPSAAPN